MGSFLVALAGWVVVVDAYLMLVSLLLLLMHCGSVDPAVCGELHGECDSEKARERTTLQSRMAV
jgi:hypothetical protein